MTSRFNPARLLIALWAALLALWGAVPATAQTAYGPRIVRLFVVDRDSGEEKPVYYHDRRYWIAGETGRRYILRIQNVSEGRAMVVLSVDGVNVISGNTASYSDRGYILEPGQAADIKGWRKSQEEIAVFRFAPLSQSYAARTGRPSDVGVIGMAVFREARRVPPPPPVAAPPVKPMPRSQPLPQPMPAPQSNVALPVPPPPPPPPPAPVPPARAMNEAAMPERTGERLGTAHGEIEREYMQIAGFEKATSTPESVRMIEYDSYANLVAAGVIPRGSKPRKTPRPFPAERGNEGFVPDPPQ
jgi:hypothetical protein